MTLLLTLPLLIPLTAGTLSLLMWDRPAVQRKLGILGAAALLGAGIALLAGVRTGGIQAVQIGDWPAPFGITLVADTFAALMILLTGIISLAVSLYSLATIDSGREACGYYPLVQILLMGVCGAFLTGDIFNLFVWFEVMLIASFVLMALGGERPQMEGAIKYLTLNLLSSTFFLSAVGILYGVSGALNMADLARKLPGAAAPGAVTTVAVLFLIAFGIKAAVFPLFFWLPASYHTPPVAVTALFSALLTKVGVYALIRLFTLVFVSEPGYTHALILGAAGITMVTGVLGAITQSDMRRLLAFHIVSQIGYLLMGLGLFTPLALAGTVFFMAHVILAKSALFLVAGLAERRLGAFDLKRMGGLADAHPLLALLFLLPALSMAGLPPLSGFFAKLALIRAGLQEMQYGIVAAALGVSLLTLFSMMKIWNEAFWKPAPPPEPQWAQAKPGEIARPGDIRLMYASLGALSAGTLLLGLAAEPVFVLSVSAAAELLHPETYIRAVLGEGR